jgi:flagellar basal body rod protein FlgB
MLFDDIKIATNTKYLDLISNRQKWTSNNIANANTPGYTGKHVEFSELLQRSNHPFETQLSQRMGSTSLFEFLEGEPVNLQREMIDMYKNNLYYGVVTRRLSSVITLMRTASQVGR